MYISYKDRLSFISNSIILLSTINSLLYLFDIDFLKVI